MRKDSVDNIVVAIFMYAWKKDEIQHYQLYY